jgi:hypothetical protein
MPTRFVPEDVLSSYAAIEAINDNFDRIAALLDEAVMRDGSAPNSLLADLDFNFFKGRNIGTAVNNADAVNLGQVTQLISSGLGITNIPNASIPVATRGAMSSVAATSFPCVLTEPGYEGIFVFSSANLSVQVAADAGQVNYVPKASDVTGATGAWVRKGDSVLSNVPRRMSYRTPITPLRTVREAVAAMDTLHNGIVGYGSSSQANVTGGYGLPKYYVNDARIDDSSAVNTFGWALAQVKSTGGFIYFEPTGRFDPVFNDKTTLSFAVGQDNITIYAPGNNVTFWFHRTLGGVKHLNRNFIWKNIDFRTMPGPINGSAIEEASEAAIMVLVRSDYSDRFAFINCEFRHPSWHCLDISQAVVASNTCRGTIQNCIFWDAIQSHLIGVNNAYFAPVDYTNDGSTRYIFVTIHRPIYAYCLQRNPKVLGNAYVDMVNPLWILRPYETEYIGGGYPEVHTDAFGGSVQEGGWLRVRGGLGVSVDASIDGVKLSYLQPGGYSGNTGRIEVLNSAGENGLTYDTANAGLITTNPYTLNHTSVPAVGPGREAFIADLWSTAGARPDAAPNGMFKWVSGSTAYPNGETILVDRVLGRAAGRWHRVDPMLEYVSPTLDNSGTIDAVPRGSTLTVAKDEGRSTGSAIEPNILDITPATSGFFSITTAAGAANLRDIVAKDATKIRSGTELILVGSSTNPITLKQATSVTASATPASDTLTVTAHGRTMSGPRVRMSTTGTLPAPLTSSASYYAIYVDANTIKLALSYSDALAGIAIDITDTGTGTHTASIGSFDLPSGNDVVLDSSAKLVSLIYSDANYKFKLVAVTSTVTSVAGKTGAVTLVAADITDLPLFASGTFTPTLTAVANCSALAVTKGQYSRNGAIVTGSMIVTGTQTLGSTLTKVGFSLPVASNFTIAGDLLGNCVTSSVTPTSGLAIGDSVNDRGEADWVCTSTAGAGFALIINFQYEIK